MIVQGVRDKVVVEVKPLMEAKTTGGVIIPNSAMATVEPQLTCTVISIGSEVVKEIKVGDTIYCHKQSGMDIVSNGIILKILKDDEVYATVKENTNE